MELLAQIQGFFSEINHITQPPLILVTTACDKYFCAFAVCGLSRVKTSNGHLPQIYFVLYIAQNIIYQYTINEQLTYLHLPTINQNIPKPLFWS